MGYEFTSDDGTVICGNTKVIGNSYSAGISMGPAAIRYLKAFPYLNAPESDAKFTAGTVILTAAGILLVFTAPRIFRDRRLSQKQETGLTANAKKLMKHQRK